MTDATTHPGRRRFLRRVGTAGLAAGSRRELSAAGLVAPLPAAVAEELLLFRCARLSCRPPSWTRCELPRRRRSARTELPLVERRKSTLRIRCRRRLCRDTSAAGVLTRTLP